MKKKYKLTDETININGTTLYRIEALKDFSNVKKGDKGGFVESEDNLSHDRNCWIYDDAKVFDNAKVYGNAEVYDDAKVFDNAKVYGNAEVYGDAKVHGNARIYGNAKVYDTTIKGIGCGDVITAKISTINVNRGIIKFLSRKYNIKSNGDVVEHNGDAVVVLKATLSHASRLISIKKSNKSNIG